MSLSKMFGLGKKSAPADFVEQFEVIKSSVASMVDAMDYLDTSQSDPGNYWSTKDDRATSKKNVNADGAGSNNHWYWYHAIMEQDANTLHGSFRSFVKEYLSGNPYGDYSQFKSNTEESLSSIKWIAEYFKYVNGIPAEYHAEEPVFDTEAQWGVSVYGKQLSGDVNRHQRYITNLYKLGILSELQEKAKTENVHILEIGGGFGMLAYYMLTMIPHNAKYIMVDLPHMLGLAATYLAILKPELKQAFFNPDSTGGFELSKIINDADVIFIPHYAAICLNDLPYLNLALNTFSFQEMAEQNIRQYSSIISNKLRGYIYSDNFRRHPHNFSLGIKVADVLRDYFYLFPREEYSYDKIQYGLSYMWQTYIHIGTSKQKPVFLKPSTKYGDFIFGENYKLNLITGACEF